MKLTILDVHFVPDIFARTDETRSFPIDRSTDERRNLYGERVLETLIDQSALRDTIGMTM